MRSVSLLPWAWGSGLMLAAALAASSLAGCSGPDTPALKDAPAFKAEAPKELPPSKDGRAIQKKGAPPFGSSAVPR
jgi:hypothetical protein